MKRNYPVVLLYLFIMVLSFTSGAAAIEGFPGSTWGELRQNLPNQRGADGPRDLYLQGYIEQGIDWKHWGPLRLNTYGILRYQWDSEPLFYNNDIAPGVGIGLLHVSSMGDYVKFGVEHIWDRFYRGGGGGAGAHTEEKTLLYVRWFQWWDLKKK